MIVRGIGRRLRSSRAQRFLWGTHSLRVHRQRQALNLHQVRVLRVVALHQCRPLVLSRVHQATIAPVQDRRGHIYEDMEEGVTEVLKALEQEGILTK